MSRAERKVKKMTEEVNPKAYPLAEQVCLKSQHFYLIYPLAEQVFFRVNLTLLIGD